MSTPSNYQFRPLSAADNTLLRRWRAAPHVKEWWGEEDAEEDALMENDLVKRMIVCHRGKPFAYMQDYAVHGWDFEHYFSHLPSGSRGIDQYIGEADMLGLGHGSAFIAARVHALFHAGAPVVATDPHPDNARAIAVYEKVGFTVFADVIDSKWGRILPMKLTR